MIALLYLFPIVLGALAIGACWVDLKHSAGKLILAGLGLCVLVVVVANEIIIMTVQGQQQQLNTSIEAVQNWKTGQIARTNILLARMAIEVTQERERLANLAEYGWSTRNDLVQQALQAHAAREELLEHIPERKYPVVIENLPASADKMLLAFAFEELGFIVASAQQQFGYTLPEMSTDTPATSTDDIATLANAIPPETKTTDDDTVIDQNSNAINVLEFGHLVRNNDIKLVLYTLLRAGVQVKMVKVIRNSDANSARSVRFDFKSRFERRPYLSVEQIQRTAVYKR